jgi:hypothetical protein
MWSYKVYTVSQVATLNNCESKEEATKRILDHYELKESDIVKIEKID